MVLKKIINELNIGREYQEFVEMFQRLFIEAFGEKIHSLYMCGSIPKGTAKPYESDADFTILCEDSSQIDSEVILSIKTRLLEAYPFITKIDTVICTLDDVRNKPNEWGFWIKVVCINIYGDDIGEAIPPISISKQFVLDLNSETRQAIKRVNQALINAQDNPTKCTYIKGYSKKLIRGLYSLVLEDVGQWQDDIAIMRRSIIRHTTIKPSLVEFLYQSYLNADIDVEDFLEKAHEAYAYFDHSLKAMSTS